MSFSRNITLETSFLLCLLTLCSDILISPSVVVVAEKFFNVTDYGAKPDGLTDNAKAFMKAWDKVCNSTDPARLYFPPGRYVIGEVVFKGPCKSNMIFVEIQAIILASTDLKKFPHRDCMLFHNVAGLHVFGRGTIDGQGKSAWEERKKHDGDEDIDRRKPLPVLMKFQLIMNGSVQDLKLMDSKGFHMTITGCHNFSATGLSVIAPYDSPNTDGIHISRSNRVVVSKCEIGTGDDCVSIGEGSKNVSVFGIKCGPGHGISIGSLGKPTEASVRGIHVWQSSLTNTTNGLRIKTFHDSPKIEASNITFEDIKMKDVKNPIIIDQNYHSKKNTGESNVKISNVTFRRINGTSVSNVAVNLNCSSRVPCKNIELSDINMGLSHNTTRNISMSASCNHAEVKYWGKQTIPKCVPKCG